MSAHDSPLLSITIAGPRDMARALCDTIRDNAALLGIEPLSDLLHTALHAVNPDHPPQLIAVPRLLSTMGAGHA